MVNEECRKETPRDIHERAFEFAVRIVKLVRSLPNELAASVIARQIVRSGTGIGANVEEAQAGQSRKEFARKMTIACGEARETLYWLRLLQRTELIAPDRLNEIIQEADEITRILVAIVKKTRNA